MQTKVFTTHIPLPLASKVDDMAAYMERSRGWVLKQALSAWVEQEEDRRQLTLQAMEEVTADNVIDHQAVRAWADSLDSNKPLPVPDAK